MQKYSEQIYNSIIDALRASEAATLVSIEKSLHGKILLDEAIDSIQMHEYVGVEKRNSSNLFTNNLLIFLMNFQFTTHMAVRAVNESIRVIISCY
jgi:hypothetical protein